MSTEYAGAATYHATCTFPDDSDARNATTLGSALEDITDRTAFLYAVPAAGATSHAGTLTIASTGMVAFVGNAATQTLNTEWTAGAGARFLGVTGLHVLLQMAAYSDAIWYANSTAEFRSGSILTIASGGYLTVPDGGIISLIGDGGSLNYAIVTSAGAGIKIEGNPAAHGTLYMGAQSDAKWYNNSTASFFSGSIATWATGSFFTIESGCDARVTGVFKIGDGVGGAGQLTVVGAAGGTGGLIDLSGPDCFTFGATATGAIQGVLRRSNAGQITERIITGSTGSASYDPTDADTVITPALTGAQVYDLPAVAEHGSVMTFVNRDTVDALTITCAGGLLFLPTPMAGSLVLRDAAGQNWSATVKYSDGAGGHPAAGWYLTSKVLA